MRELKLTKADTPNTLTVQIAFMHGDADGTTYREVVIPIKVLYELAPGEVSDLAQVVNAVIDQYETIDDLWDNGDFNIRSNPVEGPIKIEDYIEYDMCGDGSHCPVEGLKLVYIDENGIRYVIKY